MNHLLDDWMIHWAAADWVVRGVLATLLAASVITWTVVLYKSGQFSWIHRRQRSLKRRLEGAGADALSEYHAQPRPAFCWGGVIGNAAGRRHDPEALAAHMAQALREERVRLENGMALLATIGGSAPFVGLLGTVWSIMLALKGLNGDQTLSLDLVAGPVAEALVATAVGLFAAIPALMGYNLLVRRLRRLMTLLEGNALRLIHASPNANSGANPDASPGASPVASPNAAPGGPQRDAPHNHQGAC